MIETYVDAQEFGILIDRKKLYSSTNIKTQKIKAVGLSIKESLNLKLYGVRFFRKSEYADIADSSQKLQDCGLIQVPTYMLTKGRVLSDNDEPTWHNWLDSHAERNVIDTGTKYDLKKFNINNGTYVVDIQNGGFVVNRPEIMKLAERSNCTTYNMKNGAFNITSDMKDVLFGDGMVYSYANGKVELIKPDFMGTYDAFLEASANPNFLTFKNEEGRWPIYVVFRSIDSALQDHLEYKQIDKEIYSQLENPDLIIPVGGKKQTVDLLHHIKTELKYDKFRTWHDGYVTDRGRIILVVQGWGGVGTSGDRCRNGGAFVGVDPELVHKFYTSNKQ